MASRFTLNALVPGTRGPVSNPGACFSKLPVIAGPVKLFCFPLGMAVSKVLKMVQ